MGHKAEKLYHKRDGCPMTDDLDFAPVALGDLLPAALEDLRPAAEPFGARARPTPRPLGVHQRRAALGVWCLTTAAAEREAIIRAKRDGGDFDAALADRLARQLAELIREWAPVLPAGCIVTCPPQGASAPGPYLAGQLARQVGLALDLDALTCLRRTDRKRWHHPREAMKQKRFRTIIVPDVAIVVDDMLSSGTSMKLSLDALRSAGCAAWGFAAVGC